MCFVDQVLFELHYLELKDIWFFDLTLRENDTSGGECKLHLISNALGVFIL